MCVDQKRKGFGYKNIHRQNISLLCKWLWKLETKNGLWQSIVQEKYVKGKPLSAVKIKAGDSPCWKDILKVREYYLAERRIVIHKGESCMLWKDSFGPDKDLLCAKFPKVFNICRDQDFSVKYFVDKNYSLSFQRNIIGDFLHQWDGVVKYVRDLHLDGSVDTVKWDLNKNGIFSTKSMYKFLERPLFGPNYTGKAKLLLKIQIFMWQVFQDAILTRDNLKNRKWPRNPVCSFCKELESTNHLFSFAR